MIIKKMWMTLTAIVLSTAPFSCYKVSKVDLIDQIKGAPPYSRTLKDWTRSAKHYYYLEDVPFFVTATYKGWAMRLAYLKEYANKFKISTADQQKMYESELADHKNYNDFFITIFASKKDAKEMNKKGKWRLYLEEGSSSAKLEPASLKEIERDSVVEYFWPMVDGWTRNFEVRFSKVMSDASNPDAVNPEFSTIRLLIASVGGEETFTWGVEKARGAE